MGRHTSIHHWHSARTKRNNRHSSNTLVPNSTVSDSNTSNRTLVHLVTGIHIHTYKSLQIYSPLNKPISITHDTLFQMQWTCLLLSVASIWFQNGILSAYILMASVATSRLGLWMFDLSVIQQMQVSVLKF